MKIEKFEQYINNPKKFYDVIYLHDALITSFTIKRENMIIECDAHEWENTNYRLIFGNPSEFLIKRDKGVCQECNEDNTNIEEFNSIKILDYIKDFNLCLYKGEVYFYFYLVPSDDLTILFKADNLEIEQY